MVYKVKSLSRSGEYHYVHFKKGKAPSCDCEFYRFRNPEGAQLITLCKHIKCVLNDKQLKVKQKNARTKYVGARSNSTTND